MTITKTNRRLRPEQVNAVFRKLLDQGEHVSMQALADEITRLGILGATGRPFSRQALHVMLHDQRNTPGLRMLAENNQRRRSGAFIAVEGK